MSAGQLSDQGTQLYSLVITLGGSARSGEEEKEPVIPPPTPVATAQPTMKVSPARPCPRSRPRLRLRLIPNLI